MVNKLSKKLICFFHLNLHMRKTVLKQVKPTRKEMLEMKRVAKSIIDKIKIKKTKATLGGSGAKDTWLKGSHDIDIYVKFDHKYYAGMDISKILEKKLKNHRTLHGSRDYFQMEKNGYDIELIPIMDIKKVEDADNITDISPFHAKWVRKHKHLTDDIRLAKAFAKANGFYGAESYIKGFSGYSLEILTIHYGGFNKLMKAVSQWKYKTVLDPENYHKGKIKLNQSKTISPLVLVDPVQSTRNVTAVVSKEKYKLFIKMAKKYNRSPSHIHFTKEPFSLEKLKKKKGKLVCLTIKPLDGKRDVVGAKLLKSFEFMKRELYNQEFSIKHSGWHWEDNALLWFIIENKELTAKVKHYGPPMTSKKRLANFKAKWKGKRVYKEDSKCYVIIERKYKNPESLLLELQEHQYVISRINKIINHEVYD